MSHALSKRFRKCGESETRQPNLGYGHPRPTVLLGKIGACSAVSDFPALPKYTMKPAVLKRKRDKYPLENSPFKRKTAFRRFPRTKPDVPSQGLITRLTLRENSGSVNPMPPILQINLWTHSLGSRQILAINGNHVDIKTIKGALQQIE